MSSEVAKQHIGVEGGKKTVVYTGRINHKKGLELAIEAAKRLPDHLFILVGGSRAWRDRESCERCRERPNSALAAAR